MKDKEQNKKPQVELDEELLDAVSGGTYIAVEGLLDAIPGGTSDNKAVLDPIHLDVINDDRDRIKG